MAGQPKPELYYRIGFYQAHIRDQTNTYDDNKAALRLTDICMPPGTEPCRLVLGVTRDGPSYLLLPHSSWTEGNWEKRYGRRPDRYHQSGDYISFSPASYETHEELLQKFKTYVHKPRKDQKGKGDSSKANKGLSNGWPRASFEHSRALHHLLLNHLHVSPKEAPQDLTTPFKLSIEPTSRWRDARFVAFSFSRLDERDGGSGQIRDVGWSYLDIHDEKVDTRDSEQLIQNLHINVTRAYRVEGIKTETLSNKQITARLFLFFMDATPERPLVLLVYNQERTLELIRRYGIDTSDWATGLFSFLYPTRSDSPSSEPYRSRSRSRSPTRNHKRPRSPASRPRSHPRIFVVDVEEMFSVVTRLPRIPGDERRYIREQAGVLGLGYDCDLNTMPLNGFNAGHDSAVLAEMWGDMASGLPVDDQIAMRNVDRKNRGPESPPPSQQPRQRGDDGYDPNDDDDDDSVPPPRPAGPMTNMILDQFDDLSDEDD